MLSRKLWFIQLLLLPLFFADCTKSEPEPPVVDNGPGTDTGNPPPPTNPWLIPQSAVFDGGPGKDGIAAISEPKFLTADQAGFLEDDELILGIRVGDEVRAYPHRILDWHEIVNDQFDGHFISITYCPLTGTGVGWDRELHAGLTTFGVSGLLYNTNLIAYDRRTDSNWSQMLLKCVNGEQIGVRIKTYPLLETTWGTWKKMFPHTQVLSTDTGYRLGYSWYPYGDYRTNNTNLYFPVEVEDNRLPWKERVLGVVSTIDKPKAYRFGSLPEKSIGVINDGHFGNNIVVVGSREMNFMAAFNPKLDDGTVLGFKAVEDALPVVMMDHEGTMWDIFGQAVSGPREGAQLEIYDSFIGFWVAWGAFYPNLNFY